MDIHWIGHMLGIIYILRRSDLDSKTFVADQELAIETAPKFIPKFAVGY